jgi:pyridoxal phosphate enzyme (YggS family)
VTATTAPSSDARRRELAANLLNVQQRIAAACSSAGRSVDEVALIAITKTFPASDVVLLAQLGITDVGENRDQDAAPKVAAVETAYSESAVLRWHFVGALQTNKCASVVRYASLIHSVDRLRLVEALGRAAHQATIRCLVQVDLDEATRPGRAGARPVDVGEIADAIATDPRLELGGVMAVAPLNGDPATAFAKLAEIADGMRQHYPSATIISAGMSGDLEQAVVNGATHLRVGSALLGARRHPVR